MLNYVTLWHAWLASLVVFLGVPLPWNVLYACLSSASTADSFTNNVFLATTLTSWTSSAHCFRHSQTTKLWDALTGKELLTLYAPDGLMDVDFSPDGSQLAAASRDGTNRIYLLKLEDLMELARQRVTRSLTKEECQRYLHVATCPTE